jgi:hypothetical protein
VNYTRTLSPTFITEARIGLGRYSNKAQNLDYGTNASEAVGIKGANLDDWSSGLSSMNVSGYPNPLVGYSASIPWNRAETNIDFVSNWTKIKSNHTFKWGVDIRRLRDELLQTQDAGGPRGEFVFQNNQTSAPGATVGAQVNPLASLLLDAPQNVQRDLAVQFPAYRAWMVFSYFQDKWQVSQKLTIDLGLRHDFYPPATPRLKGGFSNYDPSNNTLVVAGYGNNPMNLGRKTYYTGFAPRVGVSYRINPKTVLRAGYGMSWIPFPDNKYAFDNFPVKQTNAYPSTNSYGQSVTPSGQFLSMGSGFPALAPAVIPDNGIIAANTPQLLAANIASYIPLDYREGYIQSWNFAFQRQLPKNWTIDLAYVANHTVRAPVAYNLNASFLFGSGSTGKPYFQKFNKNTDINYRYAGYSNNYNSLQVKLDRRFAGGFVMTNAVTWAKAMGSSSEDGGLWNYIQQNRNYARLDFDRTLNWTNSWVWELPFGKGKKWAQTGAARWIVGGWQLNGVLSLMTGRPMTFGTTAAANTPGSTFTPDQIGEVNITHAVAGTAGSATWFDTSGCVPAVTASCFLQNPPLGLTGRFGTAGRNNFSGPGLGNLDLSIFRKFDITERAKLEFRAESTNVTNSPAFANPNLTLGDANFGKITGTLAGLIANQGVGGTGPRAINLGLKLTF